MSDLVFIGTSDAFGAGGRRQSAILLRAPGGSVLLDCGITTNTGTSALGIDRREIDAILVSHFHGDHFGGIPLFLLASVYEDRRTNPLTVAGPIGIERRVRELGAAMGHPLEESLPFDLAFRELGIDSDIEVGPVVARAFETHHSPTACPHGFVVRAGNRRIAYSGDTGWFDDLPARVAGADVFVCECTLAEPGYEYHLDFETLSERREQFDTGRLMLTHLGAAMNARRAEIPIETADDGLEISI